MNKTFKVELLSPNLDIAMERALSWFREQEIRMFTLERIEVETALWTTRDPTYIYYFKSNEPT